MKLGLQVNSYTWPGGAAAIGPTLAGIARTADDVGFDSLWVMDHFFQIGSIGKVDEEMLESYATLSFLAAHTHKVRLGTLVTGVHYRQPGVLIKQVTTLDVLSGGRAWLGIGAGWNERESRGLVSLPVEFNLQGTGGLRVMINRRASLLLEAGYRHISNASIKLPNRGVDSVGGAVGFGFFF